LTFKTFEKRLEGEFYLQKFLKILKELFSKSFLSGGMGAKPPYREDNI